jgi:hypothetical protein
MNLSEIFRKTFGRAAETVATEQSQVAAEQAAATGDVAKSAEVVDVIADTQPQNDSASIHDLANAIETAFAKLDERFAAIESSLNATQEAQAKSRDDAAALRESWLKDAEANAQSLIEKWAGENSPRGGKSHGRATETPRDDSQKQKTNDDLLADNASALFATKE